MRLELSEHVDLCDVGRSLPGLLQASGVPSSGPTQVFKATGGRTDPPEAHLNNFTYRVAVGDARQNVTVGITDVEGKSRRKKRKVGHRHIYAQGSPAAAAQVAVALRTLLAPYIIATPPEETRWAWRNATPDEKRRASLADRVRVGVGVPTALGGTETPAPTPPPPAPPVVPKPPRGPPPAALVKPPPLAAASAVPRMPAIEEDVEMEAVVEWEPPPAEKRPRVEVGGGAEAADVAFAATYVAAVASAAEAEAAAAAAASEGAAQAEAEAEAGCLPTSGAAAATSGAAASRAMAVDLASEQAWASAASTSGEAFTPATTNAIP